MSELEKLRSYARRASIALGELAGGGSEMFEGIEGQFYATPELCRDRINHRFETCRKLIARGQP